MPQKKNEVVGGVASFVGLAGGCPMKIWGLGRHSQLSRSQQVEAADHSYVKL